MPLRIAVPESGSTSCSSQRTFELTPACCPATAMRVPGAPWPQPCGMETTPGMTSVVTCTGSSTVPVRALTRAGSPSTRPSRSASSGWTQAVQRGGPDTRAGRLCIQELFERRSRRPTSTIAPSP